MNLNVLSRNELAVLKVLWSAQVPLSRPEILEQISSYALDWNPSSIHAVLNNLMKKGCVYVAGITPTGQRFGRTYAAAVTQAEYAARLALSAVSDLPEEALVAVMAAMIQRSSVSKATIALLEKELKQQRQALRERGDTDLDKG